MINCTIERLRAASCSWQPGLPWGALGCSGLPWVAATLPALEAPASDWTILSPPLLWIFIVAATILASCWLFSDLTNACKCLTLSILSICTYSILCVTLTDLETFFVNKILPQRLLGPNLVFSSNDLSPHYVRWSAMISGMNGPLHWSQPSISHSKCHHWCHCFAAKQPSIFLS